MEYKPIDGTLQAIHETIFHDQPEALDELLTLGADKEAVSVEQSGSYTPLS